MGAATCWRRTPGCAAIVDELAPLPGDILVDKHRISGFWDTPLDSILRNLGVKTILFAGCNTDQCVLHSLTDANFLGYGCVMLEDCCATSSPAFCTEATIWNVKKCFGFVSDSGRMLEALKAPGSGMSVSSEGERPGAWVPGAPVVRGPLGAGPLDGLSFGVKDLIDVAGAVTGGGNPDWAASHAPALEDAWAVRRLREAGASLAGKTITDELAFSLEGENAHHGTPLNPRAPDRVPGGSSSGSASSVACGLVDFALGTDTGGSVRVPASFCGLFGMRPSHGAVPLHGVVPFAPSLDTVGWMTRDAGLLERVGDVLLPPDAAESPRSWRLLIAADVFADADPACAERLLSHARRLGAHETTSAWDGDPLDWLSAYATLQGDEIRRELGPWIDARRPKFGPAIAPRFESTRAIVPEDVARWRSFRQAQRERLQALLRPGTLLVLPTAPTAALRKTAPDAERADFYRRALPSGAIAGLAGLPQVTLPVDTEDGSSTGAPIGLSLIAATAWTAPCWLSSGRRMEAAA